MKRLSWRRIRLPLAVAASLLLLLAVVFWWQLLREVELYFDSDAEHFKYGSVGVEAASGIPLAIWQALPAICPDTAPKGGYADFGFIFEPGHDAPIGLPVKTVGFERVGINCALCHTANIKTSADAEPRLYLGAPSPAIDLQAYLRFVFGCVNSDAFTPANVMAAVKKDQEKRQKDMGVVQRSLFRLIVVPQMKSAIAQQSAQLSWMEQNPDWGPGRQDPFNPAKTQVLGLPFDGSTGNADIPPLWNFANRKNHALHWDGLNDSLTDVFLNSGIGNGANASTINVKSLTRIQNWVTQHPAPRYPFAVDPALAEQGEQIFSISCAVCHAPDGQLTGKSIPIATLKTDPRRLSLWGPKAAGAFMALDKYDWRYHAFRDSYGYVAVPLDGIWARAPYLHNGSVPSLKALLQRPEQRPKIFWRGSTVYDPSNVGFLSIGDAANKGGFRYNTSVVGNSNSGHLWGTSLPQASKTALLEYLKTL